MSKKKVLLRGVFINRDTNGEGVLKVGTTLIRVSTVMGILYSAFTYCSDDTMIENGMKMVVRDTSYLDLSLEYYEYKNVLFRGKQILKQVSNRTYWIYNSDGELIETGIYDD